MKNLKINFKSIVQSKARWLMALIAILTLGVGEMGAQTFSTAQGSMAAKGSAIQSQQMMGGGTYTGTVYEPFGTSTPSEQSEVGASYSPAKAPGNPRKSPLTPGDPGQGPSPVGEPWVMLAFALAMGVVIAVRQHKRKLSNSTTNMKNNKLLLTIALFLTLGVGQMWGTKKIYFRPSSDWKQDGAWFRVWDGSSNVTFSTTNISGVYQADIDDNAGTIYLKRMKPNDSDQWNECSVDATTNNYFYNSTWCDFTSLTTTGIVEGGYIYFDNSITQWTGNIQIVIGRAAYSRTYEMTQISNTQIWYVNLGGKDNHEWADATYYAFISSGSKFGDGAWGPDNITNATGYTATYTGKYSLNSSGSYWCVPSAKANGSSFTITYKSGYSSIPKFTATSKVYTRTKTGNTYSLITSGSWPTTVSIQGTVLNGNGSSNRTTTNTTSGASGTYSAVTSGLITMSYTTSADWYFEGWTTAASTAANTSTSATCEYNISAATTAYAYFTQKHAVTFDAKGTKGSSSVSAAAGGNAISSGDKIKGGTQIVVTASPATGYEVEGWYSNEGCTTSYTSGSGGVTISGSGNVTFTLAGTNFSAAKSIYCKFQPKTYSVTLHDNNGGSNNGSATATYYTTTLTSLSAPSRTGYHVTGYYTNDETPLYISDTNGNLQASKSGYTDASSRWTKDDDATLYAHWDANTYTVTLDKNGGDSDGSITTTYDSSTGSSFSEASRAGYSCDGYFTDDEGGTEIIDKDGNLKTGTVSGWLSSGAWVNDDANIKLYAHWTVDLTYYDVTFDVGTGYTSYGSLSAKVTSTSAAITSGDDLVSGTGITFTATPGTGYEVAGFYSDATCETELQSGTTTTYTIASLSDDVTVYVKFVEKTWTVAFAAGAGGSVTTPNSTPQTVGQVTGISIAATPSAGYTFNSWSSSTGGSFVSGTSTNSNTFKPTANTTVTASFNETTFAVTINNGTGDTEVSAATTKATVTCDNAETGKKFSNWTITGSYTLTDATTTSSRTIKFYATSDVTVTANYVDRDSVVVYFQNKDNWSKVHAYVWKESGTANAGWPGEEITDKTKCINGMVYHYFSHYTDDNGEGDDQTANAATWNQVIFSNNGSSQTANLSISNGHYYRSGAAANSTGADPTADEWYLKGDWDSWGTGTAFSFSTPCGKGTVDENSWAKDDSHAFKIYRSTTSEWWRYDGPVSLGSEMALTNASGSDNTYSPTTASDYQFRLDVSDVNNPVLTLIDKNAAGYTVTLKAGANGSVNNAGSLMIYEAMNTEITAVPKPGYNFDSWSVDADHASHVTITGTNPATITANDASAEGAIITANFNNTNMIYFDKSAVMSAWAGDDIYVTFFHNDKHWAEYWEGSEKKQRVAMENWVVGLMSKKMDRIPNTNIYYTNTGGAATQEYMFTDKNMSNGATSWEQAVVARGDFNSGSGCNMFVVENYVEKTVAKTGFYYGYWMKYNETTPGIKLHIYEKGGTTDIEGSPFIFSALEAGSTEFTVTVPLAVANNNYGIELKGDNGIYYKNSGELVSNNCTNWDYVERQPTRGTITTTAAGDYVVTLSCANKLFLSVEYPLQVGDYRIVYSGPMDTTSTVRTHSSKIIRQLREGETSRKDTISFFVIDDGEGDPDWSITLQKCTALIPDITWTNACVSATHTSTALSMTGKQGVYIFPLTLESSGGCDGITLSTPKKYTGNFYIRTDGAKGGWEAYKKATDNCMGYSNFSEGHSGYGFYYCHFGRTNDNVKFVVANDYSPEVSLTLDGGDYIPSDGGNKGKLPYDASIRFMYDSVTNVVRRAYLNGSSYGEAKYLLLKGDSKIKRADIDQAFADNDTTFTDNGNWIYQLDLRAKPGARVRLTSNYRFNNTDHLQYFKGKEGDWGTGTTEQILGGEGEAWSTLRIIYDFKTNHLVSAWLATDDPVVGPTPIFADVMIVREAQEDPVQITFNNNLSGEEGKLTDVGIVYSVMKFDKSTVNGDGSPYERSLFFISFPFDVKISEIFGFGGFCNQWYLEYYDGKGRAENGFWAESATNWKFITDRTETLKANVGYVLALDLDLMGTTSSVWDNTSEVCLYFPSADTIHNIQATTKSVDIDQTGYLCTIDRYQGGATGLSSDYDRRIKDSYWHCIGVPSFANKVLTIHNGDHDGEAEGTAEYWTTQNLPYFYEWNKATNEMTVKSAANYTFVPMNAYLVQFSQSSLDWGAVNGIVHPASIVARRSNAANEQSCEFNLNMTKSGKEMDHTYVRLTNKDGVTEGFDFGQDLSKEINAYTANIYTLIGYEKAAANSMPLNNAETTTIPVGVKLAQGGEYTFAMPDGTHGVGVTLIDNETGIRTSLSALDYTINLNAGTYDSRFVLEISPVAQTPTGVEEVAGNESQLTNARKVMIDGTLYIVKDGKVFDARGSRVE